MDLLLYTANGTLPVFLVIFLGIGLNKMKFFSQVTKDEIIKLVFYVGTPCLIFSSVAEADFYTVFDGSFILFTVSLIIALVFIMILLCFPIKDPKKKGAVIQIAYRSNFAIIGLPIAMNLLLGDAVTLTAVTLSFVIITYNISAVTLLSYYGTNKKSFKTVARGIVSNPLIISTVIGLIFSVFKIPVPILLGKTVNIIGSIASSMGLIVIGATITLKGFTENKGCIIYSVFLRNVLSPILFILAGVLFGYSGDRLIILAIIASAPAAINCFVMAKNMGVDSDISAYGVSITSIVSMFSVFLSVYFIRIMGL